eukprot:10752078-Lingulodinium_polyedra.AAC.1
MRLALTGRPVSQSAAAAREVEQPAAVALDLADPADDRGVGLGLPAGVLHGGRVVGPADRWQAAEVPAALTPRLPLRVQLSTPRVPVRLGEREGAA